MSKIESLWPKDLRPSKRLMPEDILRKQAKALEEQTEGLLSGKVEVGSQGDWVTLSFFIVAPRLDDFPYRLFKVRHKISDPFKPLEIIIRSNQIRRVATREQFEKELSEIFASDATRSLIGNLLSISHNAPAAQEVE